MVIVASNVVPPPLRERDCRASCTEDSKGQDEQASQTSAVKRASNEVRVVLEDARSVVAEVELRVETNNGPAEKDACLRLVVWNVTSVLDELREVNLVEREPADPGNELMQR